MLLLLLLLFIPELKDPVSSGLDQDAGLPRRLADGFSCRAGSLLRDPDPGPRRCLAAVPDSAKYDVTASMLMFIQEGLYSRSSGVGGGGGSQLRKQR